MAHLKRIFFKTILGGGKASDFKMFQYILKLSIFFLIEIWYKTLLRVISIIISG